MQLIPSRVQSPPPAVSRDSGGGDANRSVARWVPDRRRRRPLLQLLGSVVLLVGVIVAYLLQASVGAGAVGAIQLSTSGASWGSVLQEARVLNSMIATDGSLSEQRAAIDRWSPQIDALADEIAVALAAPPPTTDGGEPDLGRLRADQRHLRDLAGGDSVQSADSVLDSVIADAAVLASGERSLRIDRLETASRTAVHLLGIRMLVIAMAVVAAAVGVIGLTLSVSDLGAVTDRP